MGTNPNPLTEWARVVMRSLYSAGVRDVVISPGARNTAFSWAASREPGLRCHSVLDERSASFFALGLTRASKQPAALLCTSGSAGAHYLPALVEATHAHHPLIVITADRPSELQQAGAPQTVDQVGLYGHHVRECFHLGDPNPRSDALRALARKVAQAVHAALSPYPAPVHINAPARKPLEPDDAPTNPSSNETTIAKAASPGTWKESEGIQAPATCPAPLVVSEKLLDRMGETLSRHSDVLLSVGPVEPRVLRAAARLSEVANIPMLCELPTEAAPLEGLARKYRAAEDGFRPPRLVLHVGPPPLSPSWQAFLEEDCPELLLLCEGAPLDPSHRAELIGVGELEDGLARLAAVSAGQSAPRARREFVLAHERCCSRLVKALGRVLATESADGEPLSEPRAIQTILDALTDGSQLFLGNSLPIRVAAWVAPTTGKKKVDVFCQRGASGIDGLIAGATGLNVATQKPTLALVGDVSAAHDLSSLAVSRNVSAPLVICIVDNQGGRIFDQLPIARQMTDDARFSFWITPPRIDWNRAAGAYGVHHVHSRNFDELSHAIENGIQRHGAMLVSVRTDSSASARLWDEVERTLREEPR